MCNKSNPNNSPPHSKRPHRTAGRPRHLPRERHRRRGERRVGDQLRQPVAGRNAVKKNNLREIINKYSSNRK